MFFIAPFLPAFTAVTVSIGEAVGIGAGAVGIGAAIKGAADYNRAASLRKTANEEYRTMALKLKRKARAVQNRFAAFGMLKLRTWTGVIREAAEALSRFKKIGLSSFSDIQVEHIAFLKNDLALLETRCVKAGDVLSALSIGVNAAVNDRCSCKDLPPIIPAIGTFGIKEFPGNGLPHIPYAAIALAGISWGLSGNAAKSAAEADAALLSRETEKMESVLAGFKALVDRIAEGESLIATLTGKLKNVLETLATFGMPGKQPLPASIAVRLEAAVSLTRALKRVIETDICAGNGLVNAQSGVVFHKIRKEYGGDAYV
jgi:hypothetical protein